MRKKLGLIPAAAAAIALIALCACTSRSGETETSVPPVTSPALASASPTQTETPPTTIDTAPTSSHKSGDDNSPVPPAVLSGEVVVTFEYERQSGSASNQYAVWIEDMSGNYIQTLFATKWTAAGGYESRPDSIAMWVEKSGIASMPDYYVDAVSGATPRASGRQSYTWNLKDIDGETVPSGEYRFIKNFY